MALRYMKYDRPRLEEDEIAFFVGWNLTERMKHTMRAFLHLTERKKANVVRLGHFFKRPANTHIARQSLPAIGRPFKSGDGGGHWLSHRRFSCIRLLRSRTKHRCAFRHSVELRCLGTSAAVQRGLRTALSTRGPWLISCETTVRDSRFWISRDLHRWR